MRISLLYALGLAACAGSPTTVEVQLAPSLISSLDGTTEISAIVAAESTPLEGMAVTATITYTDRNGTAHDVAPMAGKTDARGVFHATLTGLTWEGTGTVTVATGKVTGAATFAVLDRTPPKVTILPPTTDLHVGPGLPLDVQVHVTDEIGVSEVTLAGTGGIDGGGTTVIASGSTDATVTFRMNVNPNANTGPTIQLQALASDLSGNLAAATPVTLTVDPTITIATPPGLSGSLLTDGTATQLVNPRAIGLSPHDNMLYVADQAGTGACNPSCVWQIDPTSGAITATPFYVGTGQVEEVAFDATGDNIYISDRSNKVVRLTWNGTAYATATTCDDTTQQRPQDPYHLVFDATLGILVVDGNRNQVERLATCATTTVGTDFAMNPNFDAPRGIAAGAAGEFYVSDNNRDQVYKMTNAGALSGFENIRQPWGMEWLAGGTSPFANTLLVASQGDRIIASTTGKGALAATYLRNPPIDLTVAGGTMYIVVQPFAGTHGRVYKVTGL